MEKLDPYLTTLENAQFHGKSIRTITRWRHANDEPSKGQGWGNHYAVRPFDRKTKKQKTKIETCLDPIVWNTQEWLYDMYVTKRYGIWLISKMIKRSYLATRLKLIKFKIPIRSHHEATKSTHPCCNAEWLEDNYVFQGMSLRKCADLAEVTPYTIYSWLVYYKFEIRDRYDANMGKQYIKKDGVPLQTQNAQDVNGTTQE
jgi:hypothetical protein